MRSVHGLRGRRRVPAGLRPAVLRGERRGHSPLRKEEAGVADFPGLRSEEPGWGRLHHPLRSPPSLPRSRSSPGTGLPGRLRLLTPGSHPAPASRALCTPTPTHHRTLCCHLPPGTLLRRCPQTGPPTGGAARNPWPDLVMLRGRFLRGRLSVSLRAGHCVAVTASAFDPHVYRA